MSLWCNPGQNKFAWSSIGLLLHSSSSQWRGIGLFLQSPFRAKIQPPHCCQPGKVSTSTGSSHQWAKAVWSRALGYTAFHGLPTSDPPQKRLCWHQTDKIAMALLLQETCMAHIPRGPVMPSLQHHQHSWQLRLSLTSVPPTPFIRPQGPPAAWQTCWHSSLHRFSGAWALHKVLLCLAG